MKIIVLFLCFFQTLFLCAQADSLILFYKIGEFELTTEQMNFLIEKLEKTNSETFEIEVVGSADFIDTNPSNQTLSENRSIKVVDFIFDKFPGKFERITFRGIGEQPQGASPKDEKTGIPSHRTTTVFFKPKYNPPPVVRKEETAEPKSIPESKPKLETLEKFKDLKVGDKIVLENLQFFGGRHRLRPSSIPTAKELLQLLKDYPKMEIEIHGHICCGDQVKEPDGYDYGTGEDKLSFNRAKNIYEFLVKNGIDSKRLSYKGFGFKNPLIYPERSEKDRNLNRRVEIKVVKN